MQLGDQTQRSKENGKAHTEIPRYGKRIHRTLRAKNGTRKQNGVVRSLACAAAQAETYATPKQRA